MILKRKLLLVFAFLFILSLAKTIKAQPTPSIGIVLNEYCASNVSGPVDNFGIYSDWVELANVQSYSLTLANYYLSNDRKNLKKWAFPASFAMSVGGLGVVWLSGRNGVFNGQYHANFTLEQCKNQWLILSTSTGAIRDSVFVQSTMAGHTRGRIDYGTMGIRAWRLYTTNSQMIANPLTNYYMGYLPKPSLVPIASTSKPSVGNATLNTGYFGDGNQSFKVLIEGRKYDTINYPCYDVFYTTNGDYPRPGNANTMQYSDTVTPINIDLTTVIRLITVPRTYTSGVGTPTLACPEMSLYLNSFCETNTYFIEPAHQTLSKDFGVVSIALDYADTAWFTSRGNPSATTIHVEYYDNKKHISEGYGLIERPINETWLTKQKGYNISIDDKNGFGCNFEGPIFNVDVLGTSKRQVFPTLQLYGGDIESHSTPVSAATSTSFGTGIRDIFIQSLAAKYNLNVNPLHIKPVIAFVNGKYAGVFNFKEVFDKYYENFYNGQSLDSLDMCFYHNGDGSVNYRDGSISNFNSNFKSTVIAKVATAPNLNTPTYYNALMATIDKTNLMDYMIFNSFFLNSNVWNYNVALARGGQSFKPGGKYHYYLWNMPATLTFTNVATNISVINNVNQTPCIYDQSNYTMSNKGYNGAGYIFSKLMAPNGQGNDGFKLEYKNRFQDLLNSALKCENLMKHFDNLYKLYITEMKCHEDPGCTAGLNSYNNAFTTVPNLWDTNVTNLRARILQRCDYVAGSFSKAGCYGVYGPYDITVKVEPEGAGTVKLNSLELVTPSPNGWTGKYYQTLMSFKATPTNTTNYTFHHWKFDLHKTIEPSSLDSVTINFFNTDQVTAVFTDRTKDIISDGADANVPTAFSPNGDGKNDRFKPMGSVDFVSEYQMTIWNRWGQEVYRSIDPMDAGWDGNFNGQQAITGVYAYVITYKNVYGEAKLLKSNVTLLR